MSRATLEGFDPEMSFEEGLWVQWQNRAKFSMNNLLIANFFEQLRNSTYKEKMVKTISAEFEKSMGRYMQNAVDRGEINEMTLEVYWSVAFAPLYSLIRFHNDGKSLGGRDFRFTPDMLKEAFGYVVKGLKK
jgi:hypothetical protein